MSVTRRTLLISAGLLAGMAAGTPATAQGGAYPSRPIRVVVPFPAGGTTDLLARVFGQRMSVSLGQPMVIVNTGGAGGSVGAESVARADADGYTLLFHNLTFSTTTVSLQLAGRARHDIEKDFRPVSLAANVPMLLVVNPSIPAKDLREFAEFARRSEQPLLYGSTGPGSVMNLASEVFKRDAGIKMDHVAFRGAAPMVQELIAGRVQFGGDQLSTSLEFVRYGSLRPLATLADTRASALPDVPTVRELGFPNMEMRGWNGYFAPAGTPDAVVGRLQEAIKAAADDPEVRRRLVEVGAEPVGSTPAELAEVVREQVDKVRPLIGELKLVVQ